MRQTTVRIVVFGQVVPEGFFGPIVEQMAAKSGKVNLTKRFAILRRLHTPKTSVGQDIQADPSRGANYVSGPPAIFTAQVFIARGRHPIKGGVFNLMKL